MFLIVTLTLVLSNRFCICYFGLVNSILFRDFVYSDRNEKILILFARRKHRTKICHLQLYCWNILHWPPLRMLFWLHLMIFVFVHHLALHTLSQSVCKIRLVVLLWKQPLFTGKVIAYSLIMRWALCAVYWHLEVC